MKFPSKEELELLRELYPRGCKIVVDYMDDPQAIPNGSECTVSVIDSIGQIHVEEFGLAIIPSVDRFHKI